MSWVSFPDLEFTSSDGRFRAEAKSPDNRKIPGPGGKAPNRETFGFKYGQEQRTFRFRLLDAEGRVLWERWQPEREPSPVHLYLADDGWLVIRTHGDRMTYLIAMSPTGAETTRVIVYRCLRPSASLRDTAAGQPSCDRLQRRCFFSGTELGLGLTALLLHLSRGALLLGLAPPGESAS